MSIEPMQDYLLIRREPDRAGVGRVEAVGPEAITVTAGCRVAFPLNVGYEMSIGPANGLLLREQQILAIIRKDGDAPAS